MKVNIGPYINWYGPYQIAEIILFWKDKYEDDAVHDFGKWLAENKDGEDSWLAKACNWIHNKRSRKVKVKIDGYDTWDADSTVRLIIHPLLVKFVENLHSTAMVDKEDVPEELHSTYGEVNENDPMAGYFSMEAWKYILNEMIWAFDPEWDDKYGLGSDNYTNEGYKVNSARQQKGYELFGKYLSRIWN